MYWVISEHDFDPPTTLDELLTRANPRGAEGVELVLGPRRALSASATETDCRAAAAAVAAARLRVAAVRTEQSMFATFLQPAVLAQAGWLGAGVLVLSPGTSVNTPSRWRLDYAAALNAMYSGCKDAAPLAEKLNVRLGLVPCDGGYLMSPVELRGLIDRFNSPAVGAYLDVELAEAHGSVADWVSILGPRIVAVRTPLVQSDAIHELLRRAGWRGGIVVTRA